MSRKPCGRRCVKRGRGFGRFGDLRSQCVPTLTPGRSFLSLSIAACPRPAGQERHIFTGFLVIASGRPLDRKIVDLERRDFKIHRNEFRPRCPSWIIEPRPFSKSSKKLCLDLIAIKINSRLRASYDLNSR